MLRNMWGKFIREIEGSGRIVRAVSCVSFALFVILTLATSCENHTKRKIIKKFYSNGSIENEYEINSDSLKDGYYKSYDSSGKLILTANFKMGSQNGEQKEYYNNGKILNIGYFSNGILDSGKAYDTSGIFTHNIWPVSIKSQKDTIHLGMIYEAVVTVKWFKRFNNAEILGSFVKEDDYRSWKNGKPISAPTIKDSFRRYYVIKQKFITPGNYILDGIIAFKENGKINASAFTRYIVVLP